MARLTIYEHFAKPNNGAYTKEQVKAVIETLTEKQISYIKNRNGDDLDNPTYHDDLNKAQASRYSNVLHVIREKLDKQYKQSTGKQKNKESDTSEEAQIKENNPKSQIKYSVIETFIKSGYTETQILTIIRLLPYNYITILKSLFGKNYNEFNPNEIISHEKEAFYRTTIYPRISKSLSDRYGNNDGEIQLTKKVIIGPTKKNRTRSRRKKKNDNPINNPNEEILSNADITEEDILTKEGAEEDMKNKGKQKKSIIQKFTEKGYTREQILSVIEQLPDTHKKGIKKMDGEDIEHPVKNPSVTKKDTEMYYATILPMIERRLKKTYGAKEENSKNKSSRKRQTKQDRPETPVKSIPPKEEPQIEGFPKITLEDVKLATDEAAVPLKFEFSDASDSHQIDSITKTCTVDTEIENSRQPQPIEIMLAEDSTKQKTPKESLPMQSTIEDPHKEDKQKGIEPLEVKLTEATDEELTPTTEKSLQANNEIGIEEYIKILELIKTPTFTDLMTQLDAKSAIIIALRLGYIDGKYFTSESIANFLDIEEQEVRETTTKILNLYKCKLNSFIDLAVSYDTNKGNYRKLVPEKQKPKTE